MRLLLIDDDEVFRHSLQRALVREGHEVLTAADGDAALAQLRAQPCDACVLDLRLGEDSGLVLLAELLACQPDLRVLMLTGYSSIATAVAAIKRGAHQYLAKPATVADILKALAVTAPDPVALPAEPHSVDRLAWEHIQRVLAEEQGNISACARRLGMHRRTLQRRLAKRPVAR